jgi:predicted membrane channel-forming protein YqfA (hemolysin III family)
MPLEYGETSKVDPAFWFWALRGLDYLGIFVSGWGQATSFAYFAFYQCQTEHRVYQLVCGAGCLAGAVTTVVATKGSEFLRTVTIGVVCALSGITPMAFLAMGGSSDDRVVSALTDMATFYLAMGAGAVVFVLRLPQKVAPGIFDLLPGHVIWHLAVLFANICAFSATFTLADMRIQADLPEGSCFF